MRFSLSPDSAGADCLIGRIEKNLWRQGSQRKEGKPRMRPKNPIGPGTYSGAIRLRSKLPQMAQCAYFHRLNGTERARKRIPHSVQDRKSTRLNSSHLVISYAAFCL